MCYCRYSSTNQTENSIEAQLRAIRIYCKEKKLTLSEVYIDRAKTGTHASKRPEFLRMIDDAKNGKFVEIIVHKLDRFGRNSAEVQTYIALLKDCGVKVTSVVEAFDDSPSGKLILQIMSDLNEFYSSNLSLEVMKGLKEKAYNGHFLGGVPNYGYSVNAEKKLEINASEARAVSKIFEMFCDSYSYMDIANWLNDNGFRTREGNPFGKNSLYSILKNPKYKGEYIFNRSSHAKSDGRRNSHEDKPEEEIIRIPGGVPAIVPEQIWNRAQERLNTQKDTRPFRESKYGFLLTGLLFCGECGSRMCGNSHYRKDKKTNYLTYRCSKKNNTKTCKSREARADILEAYVLSELKKMLQDKNVIKEMTDEVNRLLSERAKDYKDNTKNIRDSLAKENASRRRIVEAIASVGISPALQQRLFETEGRISELQAQLAEFSKEPKPAVKITLTAIKACLNNFNALVKSSDIKKLKRFISDFVEKITVFSDHVEIEFKLPIGYLCENSGTHVVSAHNEKILLENGA